MTKERLDNRWFSQPAFDFAVGSYDDGYETAPDVIHIRKVLFIKPLYFVVTDLLLPMSGVARDCEATVQFQFARRGAQLNPETHAVREGGDGAFAVVCPAAPNSLKVTLHEGEENPPAGWIGWSLHQNLKEPATLVRYSQSGRPPLVFDTVILPCAAGAAPALTVKRLPVTYDGQTVPPTEATALEIASDRFRHVIYLSHSPSATRSPSITSARRLPRLPSSMSPVISLVSSPPPVPICRWFRTPHRRPCPRSTSRRTELR